MMSVAYMIFAALGLGFLIFIHELGHYWMARRQGMKVEAFGIGFGKPLYTWERKGVKWHLCWLPFGGYVKIAGMDSDGDPYEIPGSFFSKGPLARIKVAFMGPLTNLLFAFLVFCLLWATGGRIKNFSDVTSKIGWVDPQSELYQAGLRPGDEITSYNSHLFQGAKDHFYAPMASGEALRVEGSHVNYKTGQKEPFDLTIKPYELSSALEKGVFTAGILAPASYVFYRPHDPSIPDALFLENSPMQQSGIEPGDRLVWADGVPLFSFQELGHLLNDGRALLTIQRGSSQFLRRVPRVPIEELKLDSFVREELIDWQHEAQLSQEKFTQLYTIPYNLTPDCVVENPLRLIEKEAQEAIFPEHPFSELEKPLETGDRIVAVDSIPVKKAYQLLFQLQTRKVSLIVQRDPKFSPPILWSQANGEFDQNFPIEDIQKMANTIGNINPIKTLHHLVLLNPVTPKMRKDFAQTPEKLAELTASLKEQRKALEAIEDTEKRNHALAQLDQQEQQWILGLPGIQDRQVIYRPNPVKQFIDAFKDIWNPLVALFTGNLSPKWMAGPIGIVQVVHNSWAVGFKEFLFWMGFISFNLAVLNLLPIPVLDGGYICLFLVELFTKRRIKPKALEKLVIPFVILVIGFLLYATYNDISRLITGLFN